MRKKVLLLVVLCFGLLLVGCNKTTTKKDNKDKKENVQKEEKSKKDNSIVGKWEYEGGYFVYTFNEDKTGSYDAAGQSMKFKYSIDGNKISMTYDEGGEFNTEFSISGNKLNIKDSTGSDTIYIKKQ